MYSDRAEGRHDAREWITLPVETRSRGDGPRRSKEGQGQLGFFATYWIPRLIQR